MKTLAGAYAYAIAHRSDLYGALEQHLLLVGVALGIGIAICTPL